jgi:hypothetical protein
MSNNAVWSRIRVRYNTEGSDASDFFNYTGANILVHGWDEQQPVVLMSDILVDLVEPGTYRQQRGFGRFRDLLAFQSSWPGIRSGAALSQP